MDLPSSVPQIETHPNSYQYPLINYLQHQAATESRSRSNLRPRSHELLGFNNGFEQQSQLNTRYPTEDTSSTDRYLEAYARYELSLMMILSLLNQAN